MEWEASKLDDLRGRSKAVEVKTVTSLRLNVEILIKCLEVVDILEVKKGVVVVDSGEDSEVVLEVVEAKDMAEVKVMAEAKAMEEVKVDLEVAAEASEIAEVSETAVDLAIKDLEASVEDSEAVEDMVAEATKLNVQTSRIVMCTFVCIINQTKNEFLVFDRAIQNVMTSSEQNMTSSKQTMTSSQQTMTSSHQTMTS